jgi:hypothetical protein
MDHPSGGMGGRGTLAASVSGGMVGSSSLTSHNELLLFSVYLPHETGKNNRPDDFKWAANRPGCD